MLNPVEREKSFINSDPASCLEQAEIPKFLQRQRDNVEQIAFIFYPVFMFFFYIVDVYATTVIAHCDLML